MPGRRRVLLVSGPASGGIRRHLQSLLAGMPAHDVELGVAAPSQVLITSDGADTRLWCVELGDRPRPLADLAALIALRRAASEFRPDLVHAHGVKAALLALLLPLPGRVPVLVTLHNLWQGGKLTPLLRRTLPRAVAVICVSEAVRDSFVAQRVPITVARIISNGVSLPPIPERQERNPLTVAYVGRLTREKGVDLLLEAWESVAARQAVDGRKRLRLVIAGDGPLRAEVRERLERLGESPPLGHIEDVRKVYSEADLVVIPSRSEGQSLTALEAMSFGLPVIASDAGGLSQVVEHGETGLLVLPESAAALFEAIVELTGDGKRRSRMGNAGRARVERHFSIEQMLERTAEAYRTCGGGH